MADIVQSWLPGGLSETAKAPIRKRGLRRLMRRHSMIAFLMCLPLIAIVVGLIIYPAFYSIYLSMLKTRAILNKTPLEARFVEPDSVEVFEVSSCGPGAI